MKYLQLTNFIGIDEYAGFCTIYGLLANVALGFLHGLNPFAGWALALIYALKMRSLSGGIKFILTISIGHVIGVAFVSIPLAVMAGYLGPVFTLITGLLILIVGLTGVLKPRGHAYRGFVLEKTTLLLWGFSASLTHASGLTLYPILLSCEINVHSILAVLAIHYLSFIAAMSAALAALYVFYERWLGYKLRRLLRLNYDLFWSLVIASIGLFLAATSLSSIMFN